MYTSYPLTLKADDMQMNSAYEYLGNGSFVMFLVGG